MRYIEKHIYIKQFDLFTDIVQNAKFVHQQQAWRECF